jgi:hypothetical protein
MTTRPLPPPRAAGRRPSGSAPLDAGRAAVPSLQLAIPPPPGHGVDHPLNEMRRAANRVYQSRRPAYRQMAQQLATAELLDYVRQDVMMRLLEVRETPLGPFRIARYRWLDASKFRAWLPMDRSRAEQLYGEYRRKLLSRLTGLDLGTY